VSEPRTLDLHLHLLDRQVVDERGRLVCKVDDVELDVDDGGRPYITGILVGARALGPRLGGRLGKWTTAIGRRLALRQSSDPLRIDFATVTDIGSAITIEGRVEDLEVTPLEKWVDEHIIGRVPGSSHASE
jgi:sporulation protein YlmC with PRC-barrel domain